MLNTPGFGNDHLGKRKQYSLFGHIYLGACLEAANKELSVELLKGLGGGVMYWREKSKLWVEIFNSNPLCLLQRLALQRWDV